MRAVVQDRYGPPDVVMRPREVPLPTAGEGEVLIRVAASSVNPWDWHFARGLPYLARVALGLRRPRKTILGADAAGVVEAVGPGVSRVEVGQEVYAECDGGGFAERVAVPEQFVARAPAGLPLAHAAAVPLAATTALQAVRDEGRVAPGQRVLVVGASGGVGSFAVQIARALGAEVTGVCSGGNVDLVRELGASRVIDYTREDYVRVGGPYDLVVQVGGMRSAKDCARALTPSGRLVMVSGDARGRLIGAVGRIVSAKLRDPFTRRSLRVLVASRSGAALDDLREMIESGRVRPAVERTRPLAEVPQAVREVERGHTRGKVAITI